MTDESKTQELLDADAARAKAVAATPTGTPGPIGSQTLRDRLTPEEIEQKRADAEKLADLKVQARDGTLDGKIDIDAMGDVKGDGGDAKDYDDGDPDKRLGVPVWEHGLKSIKNGVDDTAALVEQEEIVPTEQTNLEMEAGRTAVANRNKERTARLAAEKDHVHVAKVDRTKTATVMTDDDDTDGSKAAAKLQAKQEADAKKAAEDTKKAEAKAKADADADAKAKAEKAAKEAKARRLAGE